MTVEKEDQLKVLWELTNCLKYTGKKVINPDFRPRPDLIVPTEKYIVGIEVERKIVPIKIIDKIEDYKETDYDYVIFMQLDKKVVYFIDVFKFSVKKARKNPGYLREHSYKAKHGRKGEDITLRSLKWFFYWNKDKK